MESTLALENRSSVTPRPPPPPPPLDESPQTAGQSNGTTTNGIDASTVNDKPFKLKFCTVCASNNNRSMESHKRLAQASYPVISFGTGSLVRLPGPSISQPNVYPFNKVAYAQMVRELTEKDPRLYRANGILNMLERNQDLKFGPERWQDWIPGSPRIGRYKEDQGSAGVEGGVVDVVITCEERCWDAVVDNLLERGSPLNRPVHVINVDIKDNHEEAQIGGKAILDLADSLNAAAMEERGRGDTRGWDEGGGGARSSFDQRVPEILGEWQDRWPSLPALWTLGWF
ncbi:RNA polymerase II subunit A C-terminal domain phosphatase [Agyrium rufum]|nr:RNA polymerase II subunit A C-terminal domain phosphatase [Agyrium rufum]